MNDSDNNNLTRLFAAKEPAGDVTDELHAPAAACTLTITLDQLESYDLNPRQSQNPLYEDIKTSILTKGLDHAPNITVRPSGQKYMIRDGGNTRLQILNELWAETQDPRFFQIECSYRPWVSEIDTLAGHLVENELHGRMLFIDRTLAAIQLRDLFMEQDGLDNLSVRELAKRITETGWTLYHNHLSVMLYAGESLFSHIPEAFWAGLGRDSVKRLRKLETAAREYWVVLEEDEASFNSLWNQALHDTDSSTFTVQEFQQTLYPRIQDHLDIRGIGIVDAEIEAIMRGGQITTRERGSHSETSTEGEAPAHTELAASSSIPLAAVGQKPSDNSAAVNQSVSQTDNNGADTPEPVVITQSQQSHHKPTASNRTTDAGAVVLEIQRLVQSLAGSLELNEHLRLTDNGVGFAVDLDNVQLSPDKLPQLAILATLAQFSHAIDLAEPPTYHSINAGLCDQLFQGDWGLMAEAFTGLLFLRVDPYVDRDNPGTGLGLLRQLEELILQFNHSQIEQE